MARVERKAYYIGTWREDVVTDTVMRQIIARSQAEKGQKVKVKLSSEGLSLSKTVLFQENVLFSFALSEVYYVTVNQRHASCVLCIMADPVKKYLILAVRTATQLEAQELASTFQALKDDPSGHARHMALQRNNVGNWTLRERNQHNAERQIREVFREMAASPTPTPIPTPIPQSNGQVGGYAPVPDGSKWTGANQSQRNNRTSSGSQTNLDNSEEELAYMRQEMETLTQELRDIKLALKTTGSAKMGNSTSHHNHHHNNHNNHHGPDRTGGDGRGKGGSYSVVTNAGVVSAQGGGNGGKEGEVRAVVEDHRHPNVEASHVTNHRPMNDQSSHIINHRHQDIHASHIISHRHQNVQASPALNHYAAMASKPRLAMTNSLIKRQITVPSSSSMSASSTSLNGFDDPLGYPLNGGVSTASLPRRGRSRSARNSFRVNAQPEIVRSAQNGPLQYRSLRVSRSSGIPSTVVKPIEEIYGHPRVTVVQRQPMIVGRQSVGSLYHGKQRVNLVHVHRDTVPVSPGVGMVRGAWSEGMLHDSGLNDRSDDLDDVLL